MKFLPLLVFVMVAALGARADNNHPDGDNSPGGLTREEQRLIESFRANPEPYREILYNQSRLPMVERHPPTPPPMPVLGPRDVIDVIVQEGAIAFNGKRAAYEPFSFRIQRGQTLEVMARRRGKSVETTLIVSFRSDGLHFDVPPPRGNPDYPERGFVVIHEDNRWKTGEYIRFEGTVDSKRSRSEAQGIGFNIRYVAPVR